MQKILTVTANPCVDITIWHRRGREIMRTWQSGGKGINMARALSALNADVSALAISGGGSGILFSALARREGVPLQTFGVSGQTRTVTTYVDIETLEQEVDFQNGPEINDDERDAFVGMFTEMVRSYGIVALCGSISHSRHDDLYAQLISIAERAGCTTWLDTSKRALSLGIAQRPNYIKPNLQELQALTGCYGSTQELARRAIELGARAVAASDGENGSLLATADRIIFQPIIPVDTVNPVGSGDSFGAGFLYGLARGEDHESCMRRAAICGAANAEQWAASMWRGSSARRLGFL